MSCVNKDQFGCIFAETRRSRTSRDRHCLRGVGFRFRGERGWELVLVPGVGLQRLTGGPQSVPYSGALLLVRGSKSTPGCLSEIGALFTYPRGIEP